MISPPPELFNFIDFNKTYLFEYKNDIYSSNGFSKLITNTFNKIYKYPYNPTLIRKLYTTFIKEQNLHINQKKQIANVMNHSLEQQLLYSF